MQNIISTLQEIHNPNTTQHYAVLLNSKNKHLLKDKQCLKGS